MRVISHTRIFVPVEWLSARPHRGNPDTYPQDVENLSGLRKKAYHYIATMDYNCAAGR